MYKKNKKEITIKINTSTSSLINVEPKKFSDSKIISKELLKGNALVIDINKMEKVDSIRMIDFITGVLFTTKGAYSKVAQKTYLIAPSQEILTKFSTQFRNKI